MAVKKDADKVFQSMKGEVYGVVTRESGLEAKPSPHDRTAGGHIKN